MPTTARLAEANAADFGLISIAIEPASLHCTYARAT